jgi:hypothetical protein
VGSTPNHFATVRARGLVRSTPAWAIDGLFFVAFMSQLHFKKNFWPLILSGKKRTTIRRWNKPRVKANSRCYAPGIGWLLVDSVDAIELDQLTAADARADGFATLKAMRKTLFEFYPGHAADGRNWFRVVFRPECPEAVAPKLFG